MSADATLLRRGRTQPDGGSVIDVATCATLLATNPGPLAEVTGGMYPEIPHGEAIAAYTPAVMRYNLEAVPERYAEDLLAIVRDAYES